MLTRLIWLFAGLTIIFVITEIVLRVIPINTFIDDNLYLTSGADNYPHLLQKDRRLLWKLKPGLEYPVESENGFSITINSYISSVML